MGLLTGCEWLALLCCQGRCEGRVIKQCCALALYPRFSELLFRVDAFLELAWLRLFWFISPNKAVNGYHRIPFINLPCVVLMGLQCTRQNLVIGWIWSKRDGGNQGDCQASGLGNKVVGIQLNLRSRTAGLGSRRGRGTGHCRPPELEVCSAGRQIYEIEAQVHTKSSDVQI